MKKENIELPQLKSVDREKCIPAALIVGIIFLFFVLIILCFSLTFKRTYTLRYNENSNLDYKVYLKPNDHYTEKFLPKDREYIATLIDNVDTTFNYRFKSAANIGMEYSYYIDAMVTVDNADGKNLFSKTENLLDRKSFTELSNDEIVLTENVKVNYDKYNDLAKNFIDTYGLTADAKLVVSLYVDVSGKHAEFEKKFTDRKVMSMTIPLTSKTINIEMNYELSNSTDEVLQYRQTVINNKVLFVFSICLGVLDIIAMIAVIVYIIMTRDNATIYKKKLEKILRDYGRYISETAITERVEDMMKTRSLRIEIIKSFSDLLDVRDSLGKPILYHEERPGEEAIFYIITDRVGYIYVMRASEIKKEKKK